MYIMSHLFILFFSIHCSESLLMKTASEETPSEGVMFPCFKTSIIVWCHYGKQLLEKILHPCQNYT